MIKKHTVNILNTLVASSVFAMLILYAASMVISTKVSLAEYALIWFPRFALAQLLIASLLLIWKMHRLNSCIFTKVATYCYSSIILFSFIYTFIKSGHITLFFISQISILSALVFFIIFYIVKVCLRKSSQH